MQLKLLERSDNQPELDGQRSRYTKYKASEYLVMADLSFAGVVCYPASEGLPYDVIVDLPTGLKRIQVKSTNGLRTKAGGHSNTTGYIFEGSGLHKYATEADFFAFVATDLRQVLYVKTRAVRRIIIPSDRFTTEHCRLSLEALLSS